MSNQLKTLRGPVVAPPKLVATDEHTFRRAVRGLKKSSAFNKDRSERVVCYLGSDGYSYAEKRSGTYLINPYII